jgi:hypothetical protein
MPEVRDEHERLGFLTTRDHLERPPGFALATSRWPNSTGAPNGCTTTRFSIPLGRAATSGAHKKAHRESGHETASVTRQAYVHRRRGIDEARVSEGRFLLTAASCAGDLLPTGRDRCCFGSWATHHTKGLAAPFGLRRGITSSQPLVAEPRKTRTRKQVRVGNRGEQGNTQGN